MIGRRIVVIKGVYKYMTGVILDTPKEPALYYTIQLDTPVVVGKVKLKTIFLPEGSFVFESLNNNPDYLTVLFKPLNLDDYLSKKADGCEFMQVVPYRETVDFYQYFEDSEHNPERDYIQLDKDEVLKLKNTLESWLKGYGL